jgi:hypothetical protein
MTGIELLWCFVRLVDREIVLQVLVTCWVERLYVKDLVVDIR